MIDFKKKETNQLLVEIRNESENMLVKFGQGTVHHVSKSDYSNAIVSLANSQITITKVILDLLKEKDESI